MILRKLLVHSRDQCNSSKKLLSSVITTPNSSPIAGGVGRQQRHLLISANSRPKIVAFPGRPRNQSMSKKRQPTLSSFFGAPSNSSATGASPTVGASVDVDEAANKRRKIVASDSEGTPEKENGGLKLDVVVNAEASSSKSAVSNAAATSSASNAAGGNKVTSFASLCEVFEKIEATTKRLQILELLTQFFVDIIKHAPGDLLPLIYLSINKLGPSWDGVELGIGETLLVKAIASATGRSVQRIKSDLGIHGDLGKVAEASRSNQPTMFKPKPLTCSVVFSTLKDISRISGNSSMNKKIDKIKFLLVSCRGSEAKFLIRALEGKLRIGLAEQSVLAALAQAAAVTHTSDVPPPVAIDILKQVYSELPYYERIIPALLEHGVESLPKHCQLTPGIPLKPMLAHPTKAISDVLNRFENIEFTCEYKYDGERAQIHRLENGTTVIFSRNQENMSEKYPDIVEHVKSAPKAHVKSFVLDAEAVAWDREEGKILPFQVLSTRKRKDVATADIKVQVCVFAFDMLYLNGESLIKKTLKERRQLMKDSFNENQGEFVFAKHMDGQSVEEIQTFLDESVHGNCEGLMVKTLEKDSSYEPSKRSRNWLKVKKDYLEGAGDSLDLVVIGGYVGKGKRTGGYGGFLLACYDEEREEYQAICKIGTGFSDQDLADHSKFFKDCESTVPKSYYSCGEGVKPDVWFEPKQVWEVKSADLSISPIYTAAVGQVDPSKGISLRFPRFIRIRDDKGAEQATTASQVADMYRNQKINHGFAAAGAEDDDY
eukprot:Partr_v1_DN27983_c0_g1_i1_m11704 putative DNA ligase